LQKLQIVKGWVADDGAHERVYDVAGNFDSDADVDLATCAPRGAGFDQLCSTWRDPDFDPEAPAFYYLRAIENPSCRWNTWVCMRAGVDCRAGVVPDGMDACCDADTPTTIRERAWTSPILYTPAQPSFPTREFVEMGATAAGVVPAR
jgi:hypothetical protein